VNTSTPVFPRRGDRGRVDLNADLAAARQILQKEPAAAAKIQHAALGGEIWQKFALIRPSAKLADGGLPAKVAVVVMSTDQIGHSGFSHDRTYRRGLKKCEKSIVYTYATRQLMRG
jgi:hypothetical protein